MFLKVVPNNKGRKNTYFCSLVESYREGKKIKHRTIKNFGLKDEKETEILRAFYRTDKSRRSR